MSIIAPWNLEHRRRVGGERRLLTKHLTFAQWLNHALNDRGLSTAQLASACDEGERTAARWRGGKQLPTPRQVRLLADCLGLPGAQVWRAMKGEGS